MKKVILTETQIKNVLDNLITESDYVRTNYMKGVQNFLNTILKIEPPLVIDGKTGKNSNTEKAIMKYQSLIKVYPVDGVWGEMTVKKMPEKHKKIFDKIQEKYRSSMDNLINKMFNSKKE